jgi:Zn-dependent M28 family amino/carboxypeptidase
VERFTYDTPLGRHQMQNIIAVPAGREPQRPVVISGHYDTKLLPDFVGANDGGSSTGFLLEMSRVLCRSQQDVMLVWLDGEEAFKDWTDTDSLYGSRAQAEIWKRNGTASRIRALINVDMIGDRDLELVHEWNSTKWLRELVWKVGRELGYGKHFGENAGAITDDHIPFLQAGIPALDLIDFDYGPFNRYWHTERDTLDKLSAESFQVIGDVLLRVIEVLESKP